VEVRSRATGIVRAVYAREGETVRQGQVLALIDDPDAQSAVRDAQAALQYEVTVRLADRAQGLLKLGLTVEAEFPLLDRRAVLVVPREAVRGERFPLVLVVEGGRLVPRPVTVGNMDGRVGEVAYLGEERPTSPGAQPRNPFLPHWPRRSPAPGRR
jgi:multidrug efflux pump subunit AcrA (membrane-fusion protein)